MSEIQPFEKKLGSLIQRARVLRNQTQERLAVDLGISVRALRKVESGEPVNASILLDVIRALGYEQDLLAILAHPKPVTIEQHQALANGAKARRRAR